MVGEKVLQWIRTRPLVGWSSGKDGVLLWRRWSGEDESPWLNDFNDGGDLKGTRY